MRIGREECEGASDWPKRTKGCRSSKKDDHDSTNFIGPRLSKNIFSIFYYFIIFVYTALSNHVVLFALLSFCLKWSTGTEFVYNKNIAFQVTFFVCIYPIKLKWPEQSEQMKQSELNVQSLICLKSFPRWHSYLKGFKLSAEYQTYCINSSKLFSWTTQLKWCNTR